jgi:hypothetical protein
MCWLGIPAMRRQSLPDSRHGSQFETRSALNSADAPGRFAPNSGYMVHVPGRICWRVGDYRTARESFVEAMRIDEVYMTSQQIRPEEDWNYAHNLAYLIAACAEADAIRRAADREVH